MRYNQLEINKKISESLKGSGNKPVKKECPFCKSVFEVNWRKRDQTFCSRSCNITSRNLDSKLNEKHRLNISIGVSNSYRRGKKVYGVYLSGMIIMV